MNDMNEISDTDTDLKIGGDAKFYLSILNEINFTIVSIKC